MRYSQKDLEIIQTEINRIAATNGGALTADMVFDEAKKPESPLHRFYEWDVQKAALAHWLETSRSLIRAVKVVIETREEPVEVRKYVVVRHPDDGHQKYTDINRVLQNPTMASQMILRAQKELHRFYLTYKHLREAAELRGTFNAIEREIMGVTSEQPTDAAPPPPVV